MAIYRLCEDYLANRIKLNNALRNNDETYSWKIMIPRDYARMESDKRIDVSEIESIPHYEIYITSQIGSSRNRRDTFLYCKFPNSDRLYTIRMYMDGGVGYEKMEHKFMLRETDELDRRIVLGFCKMYQYNLVKYCYNYSKPDPWIIYQALNYTANKMAKRIKSGSQGNHYEYNNLKPYEEVNIFYNLALI